ncbi:hypothetical protein B0H66DRAFT_536149 [Apodospora peruviana]|uniref:Uncharacterized protein n=1 Tax=Apodospora peruviana TaxID=516989 RepID=A0AAE0HYS2_9PEZI|nr:hypothetical protein B0H66DRAFT_536149 [Apodospora peruviana]
MAPSIIYVRNDALTTNPPQGAQFLTTNGSNWLYTVTAIYGVSLLALFGLSWRARAGERFFHYLFIIADFVGLIAYYAMASDLAWTVIPTSNQILSHGATRQIFFAKYVQWVVTFPAAILALGILSGISWTTILYNVALSWVWIVSYLVGAYTATNYKWGFFAFGTVAYFFLAVSTLTHGRTSATRVGISRDYTLLAGWLNMMWLLYVLAWGLSDGGNRIRLTSSSVWFGVLDVLLVPVISFAVVGLSAKWDYNRLNIAFTQYGRVHATRGTYPEKEAAAPGTTGGVVSAA